MSDETSPHPEATTQLIRPVPEQPPEQEWQTSNPDQEAQERTDDNPPTAGVSQERAWEGKSARAVFEPTPATSIDEILKAAYFVAAGIDAPLVDVVNPHVVNLHYAADGSLATIKVEARTGAWGGIGPKGNPEDDVARNAHYDEMKAAAAAPPPEPPVQEEPVAEGSWR